MYLGLVGLTDTPKKRSPTALPLIGSTNRRLSSSWMSPQTETAAQQCPTAATTKGKKKATSSVNLIIQDESNIGVAQVEGKARAMAHPTYNEHIPARKKIPADDW